MMTNRLRIGIMIASAMHPLGAKPNALTAPVIDSVARVSRQYADCVLTCTGTSLRQDIDALLVIFVDEGNPCFLADILSDIRIPVLLWSVRGDDDNADAFSFGPRGAMAAAAQLNLSGIVFTYVENCSPDEPMFDAALRYFSETAAMLRAVGYTCFQGVSSVFDSRRIRYGELLGASGILLGRPAGGRFVMRHPGQEDVRLFNFADFVTWQPLPGETVTLVTHSYSDDGLRLMCLEGTVVEGPMSMGPHAWIRLKKWQPADTRIAAGMYPPNMHMFRGKHTVPFSNFSTYVGCRFDGVK